jgi:hypothetical protein
VTTSSQRPRHPANTPHEALQRYIRYLQLPLSCISKAVWTAATPVRGLDEEAVLILPKNEPINLGKANGEHVRLFAAQRFVVIPDLNNPGEYKTRTREYVYKFSDDAGEVLEWHWHPSRGRRETHMHCRFRRATKPWGLTPGALHLPTSRVAFEDIVRFAIGDLGIQPRRDDWEVIIGEALMAFEAWRTWSGAAPSPPNSASMDPAAQGRPKRSKARRPS